MAWLMLAWKFLRAISWRQWVALAVFALACYFILSVGACRTTTPPPEQFPQPPTVLMQPPQALKALPGAPGTPVSAQQAALTVAENYSLANEIRETLISLQHWVKQQFEANKGR